jgi:hypothetical protein
MDETTNTEQSLPPSSKRRFLAEITFADGTKRTVTYAFWRTTPDFAVFYLQPKRDGGAVWIGLKLVQTIDITPVEETPDDAG